MKTFIADITQTCVTGGNAEDLPIRINIEDRESGRRLLTIEMSERQFGRMLSRPTQASASITLYDDSLAVIGHKAESCDENVFTDKEPRSMTKEEIDAALAEYEVNGWEGRRDAFTNPPPHPVPAAVPELRHNGHIHPVRGAGKPINSRDRKKVR